MARRTPLLAKGALRLSAVPRYVPSERRDELLRYVLTTVVLSEVARLVAAQVAAQISGAAVAGQRGRSLAGYQALWAGWATRPEVQDGSAWIGSIAAMNQATGPLLTKRGQWRYGAWFNLEWGREWPARGASWVFQENPGPAASPQDSKPPGAGPADIEMTGWLKRQPKTGGGSTIIGSRLSLAQQHERAFASHALMQAFVRASRAKTAEHRLKHPKGGEQYADKNSGHVGQAPIRKGFIGGLRVAEEAIPELLRQALRQIGRAR